MDFDLDKHVLHLDKAERDVLELPVEATDWDIDNAPLLLETVERARQRLLDMSLSDYRPGPERTEMEYRKRYRVAITNEMIDELIPYVSSTAEVEDYLKDR